MVTDTIQVRIGQIGERTIEYTLAASSKVSDLVRAAALETTGKQIRVNGAAATADSYLSNNAIVTLLPAVKGGR